MLGRHVSANRNILKFLNLFSSLKPKENVAIIAQIKEFV